MKKKKNLLFLFIFLIGAGVVLYPTVSDLWNQHYNDEQITQYAEVVQTLSEENYEECWQAAKDYNAAIKVNTIVDAFGESAEEGGNDTDSYESVLNLKGDGLMGSIEIPKLDVRIAIYHGLSEAVLEKGCGHVKGTGLPIGGANTHAALAAHSGLPSAKLFTNLDQLVTGDRFIIHVLGEKLVYEVDQIKIVLPHETEDIAIIEGEDLITLITCTPYGVNTHRLLVRGKRTEIE